MRKLKFRAWNVCPPEMYDLSESDYPLSLLSKGDTDYTKFMQFTGTKDFFGNDIFDGDIVFLDSKMMIGEIISDGISWRIKFEIRSDLDWLCDYHEDLHVIGNIYETPQLLN